MHSGQFQDTVSGTCLADAVSRMCLAGAVVESVTQVVAGSNPFTVMAIILVTEFREFNESFNENYVCMQLQDILTMHLKMQRSQSQSELFAVFYSYLTNRPIQELLSILYLQSRPITPVKFYVGIVNRFNFCSMTIYYSNNNIFI